MKFSIRDLILVVAMIAICLGWWADHRQQKAIIASQREAAGWYRYLTRFMESEGYRMIWENEHNNMLTILRPGETPVGESPGALAAKTVVTSAALTKELAIAIVRERIEAESPDSLYDCEVHEVSEGFSVFVTFGASRDGDGKLTGFVPGGHSIYDVSKDGKITQVISGA